MQMSPLYDIMSLGDIMKTRLKELRKARGYTQISLQMQTGIEQALLSKFETGERIPPTETLLRLADFYNVSIDYLLCRTNKPESTSDRTAQKRVYRIFSDTPVLCYRNLLPTAKYNPYIPISRGSVAGPAGYVMVQVHA